MIVPLHNATATLSRCLDAITGSSYPNVEVIVVDDRSDDEPRPVARQRGCRFVQMDRGWGAAAARNAGAREASGDLLLFIDADVVIPAGAIQQTVDLLERDPQVCGMSAIYTPRTSAHGVVSRHLNYKTHYFQANLPERPDTIYSAFFAVWRRCFEAVAGFDQAQAYVAADDLVLGVKLAAAGCRLTFARQIQVEHLKRLSVAGLAEFEFRHAREWVTASRQHPRLVKQRLSHSRRSSVNALLTAWLLMSSASSTMGVVATGNPVWLLGPFPPLMAYIGWNSRFLLLAARQGGLRDMLSAIPLSLMSSVAATAGVGIGTLRAMADMCPACREGSGTNAAEQEETR